ncbi:uncharacterized protein LOC141590257 [Silene latifolia]|uniref:uncharacterized protein LOC141590257 n=1 Tax=Silene latifolia TaxID=37657 RepID=UPI003D7769FF
MKIASWNIRGFNCPIKHSEVRDYLMDNNIDILALLETRNLGLSNPSTVALVSSRIEDQFFDLNILHHGSNMDLHISMVYDSNDAHDRQRLWTRLTEVSSAEPWLVLGDFNVARQPSEKLSNTPPVLQDMIEFNDCLAACSLDDLTGSGCDMTLNNKQDPHSRVWSKLDRVLANPGWLTSLPDSFALFQEAGISDHSPVLVHVSHDTYFATIAAAWNAEKTGSPMFSLFEKLKSVRVAHTKFHKENFDNISLCVKTATETLLDCQRKLISDPFSDVLIHQEKELVASYCRLKETELSI